MLPPPSRSYCAFGNSCASCPEGLPIGPDICPWCKNLSFDALYRQAEAQPNTCRLYHLIDDYKDQLDRESLERANKGWAPLCASKDPDYRDKLWRSDFNPEDPRICGPVAHRGQLCARCYDKAQKQGCAWLSRFDGDTFGFPCVFEDIKLMTDRDLIWRKGPINSDGRYDSSWEKDPQRHGRCKRARYKNTLCEKCFTRMNELRGFGRFFDADEGTLRRDYALRTVPN